MQISTDNSLLDIAMIHHFLSQESTWAEGVPLHIVERSIANSLCFGGYVDSRQVAFARVITDYATFAYLVDVFVVSSERGRGYSRTMMDAVIGHADLQGLRRFLLATSTAQRLYEKYGFKVPSKPQAFMERNFPDIYAATSDGEKNRAR